MNLDSLELTLFDSPVLRENYGPLALTRPLFDFILGAITQKERIEQEFKAKASNLLVSAHLANLTRERYPDSKINTECSTPCLVVNSLVRPEYDVRHEIGNLQGGDEGKNFVVLDKKSGVPIFAVLERLDLNSKGELLFKAGLKKRVASESDAHESSLLCYPWKLTGENGSALERDYQFLRSKKIFSEKGSVSSAERLGGRILISESAEVERFVTIDSRSGPVIVDEGSVVQSFSMLTGPCYVGKATQIKSALVREGTTLGRGCKVGGEIEETIMQEYSNKNHSGFLGHSLVGSWVNLGAQTTNSDLKNTYGEIKVDLGRGKMVPTQLNKVGCFLSDMCKSSIGTLIFSGRFAGVCSALSGSISRNVPSFAFRASSFPDREIFLESSIETQRRMMSRRNVKMSHAYEEMIRAVFRLTARDRKTGGVRKGKLRI